jgi:hypothetical protein
MTDEGKMKLVKFHDQKLLDEFLGTKKEGAHEKIKKKPWQAVFPCNEKEENAIREGFKKSTSKKISDYLKKIILDYHNYKE